MNKSLYMVAMNRVLHDCESCPFVHKSGKCPSEAQHGRVGVLKTCAKAMYEHLLKDIRQDAPSAARRGAAERGR